MRCKQVHFVNLWAQLLLYYLPQIIIDFTLRSLENLCLLNVKNDTENFRVTWVHYDRYRFVWIQYFKWFRATWVFRILKYFLNPQQLSNFSFHSRKSGLISFVCSFIVPERLGRLEVTFNLSPEGILNNFCLKSANLVLKLPRTEL